jgi:hypothetical protein
VRELRGHDLACWCPLPEPGQLDLCHASTLIYYANRDDGDITPAADDARLGRAGR